MIDAQTVAQLRHALERYAADQGSDRLTPGFLQILGWFRTISAELGGVTVDVVDAPAEGGLMTRKQVAALARVSPDTVSSWGLPKVGRRYRRADVLAFLEGRSH